MYLATKPSKPSDDLGDGAVIRADHLAQILGIEPRRERRRADQVAEHHRELTPFRSLDARGGVGLAGAGAAISPIGLPQPPQNLAVGSFSKPQAGQGDGNGAPHSAQKRLAAAFSAMQLGQRIWCPEANRSCSSITHRRSP